MTDSKWSSPLPFPALLNEWISDRQVFLTVVSGNPAVCDHLRRRRGRQRQAVPQVFRTRGAQAACTHFNADRGWPTSVDATMSDRVTNARLRGFTYLASATS